MEEFKRITESLRVLYRASSDQKQQLVVGLKFLGVWENMDEIEKETDPVKKYEKAMECMRVVSVTGEGVNDTDSLAQAQVGLAMGSGCAAAKDSAQLVLTENKFSSVIAAVQWGRNIFHNCTRFLQFQLTVNISLVLSIFIGIFVFSEPPMTA
jgi:P-type E1-E2 ATPase